MQKRPSIEGRFCFWSLLSGRSVDRRRRGGARHGIGVDHRSHSGCRRRLHDGALVSDSASSSETASHNSQESDILHKVVSQMFHFDNGGRHLWLHWIPVVPRAPQAEVVSGEKAHKCSPACGP
jgi:hypothetical protein